MKSSISYFQQMQQQFQSVMDEILDNSYFKTNNRNKYSFPKSDRFPDLKPKYTIDFFESSSVAKPRSTSFGFGSKFDFFKQSKMGPSPFEYSIEKNKRNASGITLGLGRETIKANSYIDSQKLKTPRPNNYTIDIDKIKKRGPSFCMLSKHPQDSFIKIVDNPDPTKYNPIDSFYSRRKKSASFAFGSARRFQYSQNKNNRLVGPGSYAQSPGNKTKYGIIGQAGKKTYAIQAIENSISPGPIYYLK